MTSANPAFSHRIATARDIPAIEKLMALAIEQNMAEFLTAKQVEAAAETMGVDQLLVRDGTYFVIETLHQGETVLVGCGGWGKRKTLYGGDHSAGRDDSLSDPAYSLSDPALHAARIRAMYTHPDWVRLGIGTLLLALGEAAAKAAGFSAIELGATVAGEPLYLARGYKEISREQLTAANGADSLVITMSKPL